MKSILTVLLMAPIYVQAISITVLQNQSAGPWAQTLSFDLIWGGPGSGPSSQTLALPGGIGFVSKIRGLDMGDDGGLAFSIETPTQFGAYEWQLGPYRYGPDVLNFNRSFASLCSDYLPFPLQWPQTALVWTLDAQPLPSELYGGRFTFSSSSNPQNIPDGIPTGPALLFALGLVFLARHFGRTR